MNKWMSPAVRLMKSLKYPQKFALIAFIFLMPVVFLLNVIYSDIEERTEFIQKERWGVEYNLYLMGLLDDLQQHRGMSNAYIRGNLSFEEPIAMKKLQIKGRIKKIDQVNSRLGDTLQSSEKWKLIKRKWAYFDQQNFQANAGKSFENHTLLIADILSLMNHIGNISNLFLDSDLENYHLINTHMKIPFMAEKIGQARGFGAGIVAQKSISVEERTRLFSFPILISTTLEEIKNGVGIVLQEDIPEKSRIHNQMENTEQKTLRFLDVHQTELLDAQQIRMDSIDYFNIATQAINSAFGLYLTESHALDALLVEDLQELQHERRMMMGFTFSILLLVLYLFTAFYLSVKKTVVTLEQTAARMSEGDWEARVNLDTKDELRLVGDSFNFMAEAFRQKIKEHQQMEEMLRESEERYRHLIDHSPEAIAVYSHDQFDLINQKGLELLGATTREELMDKTIFDFIEPAYHGRLRECNQHMQVTHQPVENLELQLIPFHQEMIFIETAHVPILFNGHPAIQMIYRDITDRKLAEGILKEKNEILQKLSFMDGLTNIANRRYFDEFLKQEWAYACPISLIMLDIDCFKGFNDTYGHQKGDQCLQQIADTLKNTFKRSSDLPARYGGEEFSVILPNTDCKTAYRLSEKLRDNVENLKIPHASSHISQYVTISVGLATVYPIHASGVAELIEKADQALYRAKLEGRNRVKTYEPMALPSIH